MKFLTFLAGDVFWKISNFVIIAIAARSLDTQTFSAVLFAQTISLTLITIGDFGYKQLGINKSLLEHDVSNLTNSINKKRITTAFFIGLPICLLISTATHEKYNSAVLLLISASWIPYFKSCDWILLTHEKQYEIGIARIIPAFLLISISTLGVTLTKSFIFLAIGNFIAQLTIQILTAKIAKKIQSSKPENNKTRNDVTKISDKQSLKISIALLSNYIFHSLDVFMASLVLSKQSSDIYISAMRILPAFLSISWLFIQFNIKKIPLLEVQNSSISSKERSTLIFSISLAALAFFSSDLVSSIVFYDKIQNLGIAIKILSLCIIFDAIVSYRSTALMIAGKHSRVTISILTATAALPLSYLLFISLLDIPDLHALIISKTISYAVLLLLTLKSTTK